ncbi:hypothetical protein CLV63_12858 [Murinocardiopsis flavida]|uniref:Uncharacterized protein n=1 Tax=Murinocardiopsis flavida TaxID=645275 RepID=A0A2P8CVJ4_9ACTN|nr:hypothetical protein CLV63_12858 [Murinocardiopsis flavida]
MNRLLSPIPYAVIAVIATQLGGYLLFGPLPAFGEDFGVCGDMADPKYLLPSSGISCTKAQMLQFAFVAGTGMVGLPATVMTIYCALRPKPANSSRWPGPPPGWGPPTARCPSDPCQAQPGPAQGGWR